MIMKKIILFFGIISIFVINWNCSLKKVDIKNLATSEDIRLNQLGYFPNSIKKAVVVNSISDEFQLLDSSGIICFTGKLEDVGEWQASKENVKIADFSTFDKNGNYKIYVNDLGISYPLRVGSDIYSKVLEASVKAYYLDRASTEIEEKYAGNYRRTFAHPDTLCLFHPSSGKKPGSMSSPKGWYDAGDYNKYIVNAGVTVSTLLTFYEYYNGAVPDNSLNIPESGNGISDLLDEIKYELDWAETMQDKDGGVFFKLTSKNFSGFVMPDEDLSERYIVGKSTTSSLNFTAMFAQASRVWRDIDPDLSAVYITRARESWNWAIQNPDVVYHNPEDVKTGEYGHSDFKGDFYWAAAELFVSTGESEFKNYLSENSVDFTFVPEENWRNYLKNLGYYALLLPESKLSDSEKDVLIKAILAEADLQTENLEKCPYRQPLSTFAWGSNSDVLDLGIIFAQAYRISHEKKYLDAAIETTDYIFGKNAVGISFVTGFGTSAVKHPHMRLSEADGIDEPIPGWIAGGPNVYMQDAYPGGVTYTSKEPARAYMDLMESFASNEIAINWNAPLVYMCGFLDVTLGREE